MLALLASIHLISRGALGFIVGYTLPLLPLALCEIMTGVS